VPPPPLSPQVRTPLLSTMLVPEEVQVVKDLADRCCPTGNVSRLANEFCNVVGAAGCGWVRSCGAAAAASGEALAALTGLWCRLSRRPPPPDPAPAQAIPAATAENRKATADLCHMPPFACDNDGHLQQLSLPGAGLDCGGKGLPESFSQLSQVQILDLAFNDIGGSTDDLAAILEKARGPCTGQGRGVG
jgi:hypothetical protein